VVLLKSGLSWRTRPDLLQNLQAGQPSRRACVQLLAPAPSAVMLRLPCLTCAPRLCGPTNLSSEQRGLPWAHPALNMSRGHGRPAAAPHPQILPDMRAKTAGGDWVELVPASELLRAAARAGAAV
jgi:hypothetical protein